MHSEVIGIKLYYLFSINDWSRLLRSLLGFLRLFASCSLLSLGDFLILGNLSGDINGLLDNHRLLDVFRYKGLDWGFLLERFIGGNNTASRTRKSIICSGQAVEFQQVISENQQATKQEIQPNQRAP